MRITRLLFLVVLSVGGWAVARELEDVPLPSSEENSVPGGLEAALRSIERWPATNNVLLSAVDNAPIDSIDGQQNGALSAETSSPAENDKKSESVDSALESVPAGDISGLRKTTFFSSFFTATAAALSITLVSELGDRTFFVVAMLATKWPGFQVWIGACIALWGQSVVAASAGALLHALPTHGWVTKFPFDDYLAGIMLCIFGIVELCKAIRLDDDDGEPLQPSSVRDHALLKGLDDDTQHADSCYIDADDAPTLATPDASSQVLVCINAESERRVMVNPRTFRRSSSVSKMDDARRLLEDSLSLSPKTPSSPWYKAPVVQTTWLVFLAEIGDGSMFATAALATAQSPVGVALGASIGHSFVSALAVSCAALFSKFISERLASLIAGALFLTFGILALIEGWVQQGSLTVSLLA